MKGSYIFNNRIDFSKIGSTGDFISKIPFLSKNTRYDTLDIDASSGIIRYNNIDVYNSQGWVNSKYKNITFFEEQEDNEYVPSKDAVQNWLLANSTKVKTKKKIVLTETQEDGTNGAEIYPKTYVTQLLNEDGSQWIPSLGGSGGMGGGGSAVSITTITNPEITTSLGVKQELEFEWSSEADGNGTLYIYVDGELKKTTLAKQGKVKVDVSNYIISATDYLVRLVVEDAFGSKRALNYQISVINLVINSTFDQTTAYTGEVVYRYTPYGNVLKTIHFFVDGVEYKQEVESSGREQTFTLPIKLTHGVHELEVYATATFGSTTVYSNKLNYKFAYYVDGNSEPIIVIFNNTNEKYDEGQTVKINYLVYTATSETTDVTLYLNGQSQNITVDRKPKVWSITDYNVGVNTLTIAVSDLDISNPINKNLTFNIVASEITIQPITTGLQLFLTSSNKSNNIDSRNEWTYNDITTTFNNFNFVSDGWLEDKEKIVGLKMTGDANIEINYKPFGDDAKVNGKTIELEFATSNVTDYDSTVINIMNNDRGIIVKPNEIIFKSLQKEISTRFKQEEHIRIAIVIERSTSNKFISTYINGVLSGIDVYGGSDDFEQTTPVNIKAGSNKCDLTLYKIRVYNNDLTATNILDNFIADNDNYDLKTKVYRRNQIYDSYGNVLYNKVKGIMPVLLITAPILPSAKDEVQVLTNLKLENINNPQLNWEYSNLEFEIQGTSSVQYPVKNLEFKFGENVIQLYPDAILENRLTLKVDYASSAGVFNMGNAKIVNSIYQEKNPRQQEDNRVRNALYGYPVAVFYRKTASDNWQFHCKGSLNLSKKANALGYKLGDESWEVKNNTSPLCLFDSNDFTTLSSDFEYRYNATGSTTNLENLISWVYSCKGNPTKFKEECEEHFNLHYLLMYYVYGQIMGGADSYAKNLYLGFFAEGQNEDGTYYGKWYPEFYDLDTSYGIDNTGRLKFEYSTELNDMVEDRYAFNGHNSVLWNLVQEAYKDELKTLYQTLRNGEYVTYNTIMEVLQVQGIEQYPEAIYNEDAKIKYITPYLTDGENYLSTALGSTLEHLKYWVNNRLKYLDSKWIASDYSKDRIVTRITTPENVAPDYSVTLKSRNDMYMQVQYGSYYANTRATRNTQYTLTPNIPSGTVFNDTEAYIYGASSLTSVGDLSKWYVTLLDISKATSLTELKVGDGSADYSNDNLKEFTAGANTLLRTLNLTNCTGLTGEINLSQCINLQTLEAKGTQITSVKFANGGQLKYAFLPETLVSLELINLVNIQNLDTTGEFTTIRIENSNVDTLNYVKTSINANKLERLRLIGIDWVIESKDLLDYLIENVKGINSIGNNQDKSVLSGKIHITSSIYSDEITKYREYWGTSLTITSDTIIERYRCRFYDYDGTLLYETSVFRGDSVPYVGETPHRPIDETNKIGYVFIGWDKSQNNIKENTDFRPVFDARPMVKATFVGYDGNTLYVDEVVSGTKAEYKGETPTKPTDYDLQIKYQFKEWSPNINENINDNTIFTPVFDEIAIYKVEWVNYDNTVLKTEYADYGAKVSYDGETPTRPSDNQYIYTFSGWSPNPENTTITSNQVFTAGYSLKLLCKVTLLNADGSVFYERGVGENEQFNYDKTPTPPEDDVQYQNYEFVSWQLNGEDVTLPLTVITNITLTPRFEGQLRKYSVFWYVDGELMETDVGVEYGTIGVTYDGVTPESPNEGWAFKGWNTDPNAEEVLDINSLEIQGDTTLYAIFIDPYATPTKIYFSKFGTSDSIYVVQKYNKDEEMPTDSLFVDWDDGNGYVEYKNTTVYSSLNKAHGWFDTNTYARTFQVYFPYSFADYSSQPKTKTIKIKYFKNQSFVSPTYVELWSATAQGAEFAPFIEEISSYDRGLFRTDNVVLPTNLKFLGRAVYFGLSNVTFNFPSSLEEVHSTFNRGFSSGNYGKNNTIKWNQSKDKSVPMLLKGGSMTSVIKHIFTDGELNCQNGETLELELNNKVISDISTWNNKFKLNGLINIPSKFFDYNNIISINSSEDFVYDLSNISIINQNLGNPKAEFYEFESNGKIYKGIKKMIAPVFAAREPNSISQFLPGLTINSEEVYIPQTLEEYKEGWQNFLDDITLWGAIRKRTYFNNVLFEAPENVVVTYQSDSRKGNYIRGLDYKNVVYESTQEINGQCGYMQKLETYITSASKYPDYCFIGSGLKNFEIPETITTLGRWAFQNCYDLKNIIVGNSVTTIQKECFYDDSIVLNKIIKFKSELPPTITTDMVNLQVFTKQNGCKILVPLQFIDTYKTATNWPVFTDLIEGYGKALSTPQNKLLIFNTSEEITLEYYGIVATPQVDVISSNPNVCSASNLTINDSQITFKLNSFEQEGQATITITLDDGEDVLSKTFVVRVFENIPEPVITIENVEGATYGFELNQNGYYESTNKGKSSSYAICKININNSIPINLTLECINSGESSFDYGILSILNQTLKLSSSADSSNVFKTFKGQSSENVVNVDYGEIEAGENFIYVKYIKDGSGDRDNDSLQFKVNYSFSL